ncbi:MAG: acyl-ACP--UDP-N-acetylglucosamine O-acyltransferase [Bacteroidota bacterium]
MKNKYPLSSIHPDARIADDVVIEPFVTVHGDVEIGPGTWVGSHASIMSGVKLGENCKIFPGAVVGAIPQDLKFKGENTSLEIGDNVIIREYCTINRGTKASDTTIIKDNALLMAYVHVAHDCVIGKNCVLANNVTLAGHIEVGDYAILGGLTAVHQFVKIGAHAFVGGGSRVRKDVPPYVKAAREPLSYAGVNSIGLKRRGFDTETIHQIQDIYRVLFVHKGVNISQAVDQIIRDCEPSDVKDYILNFVKDSQRGLMKGFKHLNGHKSK